MLKKALLCGLGVLSLFTFTACGKNKNNKTESTTSTNKITNKITTKIITTEAVKKEYNILRFKQERSTNTTGIEETSFYVSNSAGGDGHYEKTNNNGNRVINDYISLYSSTEETKTFKVSKFSFYKEHTNEEIDFSLTRRSDSLSFINGGELQLDKKSSVAFIIHSEFFDNDEDSANFLVLKFDVIDITSDITYHIEYHNHYEYLDYDIEKVDLTYGSTKTYDDYGIEFIMKTLDHEDSTKDIFDIKSLNKDLDLIVDLLSYRYGDFYVHSSFVHLNNFSTDRLFTLEAGGTEEIDVDHGSFSYKVTGYETIINIYDLTNEIHYKLSITYGI